MIKIEFFHIQIFGSQLEGGSLQLVAKYTIDSTLLSLFLEGMKIKDKDET